MLALLVVLTAGPVSPELFKRASEIIDKDLADSRPSLKLEALSALGASRRADAKPKLLAALIEEEGKTRFGGAQGLRFLADPSTAPQLTTAWRKEKGWMIKKELSLAAAACGARDLVPDLKAALLYETQLDVREAVAWALDDLGEPDAKVALATMGNPPRKLLVKDGADSWSRHVLQGKKQGDVRLAVKTLAFMGMPEDAPLLAKQLDAKDPETQLWAAAAIVRLSVKFP